MNKFIAAATVSLMAFAAHAQSNPPGAPIPPHTPGYATGKSEMTGEARKNARPMGKTSMPAGDSPKTPEGGAIGTDRAAVAGERRAETRDQRRPGKPQSMQGGTPK
jgi:hypothetical protein